MRHMLKTNPLGIIAAVIVLLVMSMPQPGWAQECDRCSLAGYLQSAMAPGATHHVAFQLDYTYRSDAFEGSSQVDDAPDEKVADTVFNLFYTVSLFENFALDFNLPMVSRALLRPPPDRGPQAAPGSKGLPAPWQCFHPGRES